MIKSNKNIIESFWRSDGPRVNGAASVLATDEDKYANELLEEAATDLLKKYREKFK